VLELFAKEADYE